MKIKGEEIYANVWGGQKKVFLTTWEEIKKLGFKVRDRAFGNLNDGTKALYFYALCLPKEHQSECQYEWYLTTEKLENLKD